MGNNLSFDISRARSMLGYVPRYSFPKDLPEFIDWYQTAFPF